MKFNTLTNVLESSGGGNNVWDKSAKSEPLTSGKHSVSIKIVKTVGQRHIMIGCGPGKPVTDTNMYSTGKFFYLNTSGPQGSWGTPSSAHSWSSVKVGDIVTLELDIEGSRLEAYLNNGKGGAHVLCTSVPKLQAYHFYIVGYEPGDVFEIVEKPF
jgi:hypothetical protein